MADWRTWPWHEGTTVRLDALGFEPNGATGALARILNTVDEQHLFVDDSDLVAQDPDALRDLRHRLQFSVRILQLRDSVDDLTERFLSGPFIDTYRRGSANVTDDGSDLDRA
jgi:hypothetical protein